MLRTASIATTAILAVALSTTTASTDEGRARQARPSSRVHVYTPTPTLEPASARPQCTPECAAYVEAILEQRARRAQATATFLTAALAQHRHPFLVCTRAHESSPTKPWHDDGYQAISPNRLWYGAYQFALGTWANTAHHANRPELADVRPDHATVYDQDTLAMHLARWQGADPWVDRCAEHL